MYILLTLSQEVPPQTRIGHKPVNTIVTTVELNSLCAFFKKYVNVKLDAAHSSQPSLDTWKEAFFTVLRVLL